MPNYISLLMIVIAAAALLSLLIIVPFKRCIDRPAPRKRRSF